MDLTGIVSHILYPAPGVVATSAWRILRFDVGEKSYIVKGNLANAAKGQTIRVSGNLIKDKYGPSIQATSILEVMPMDKDGVVEFLATLPHVGPVTAHTLYRNLGPTAIEQMLASPSATKGIKRLTETHRLDIHAALIARRGSVLIEQELHALDFGPAMIERIRVHFADHGDGLLEIIQKTPYKLLDVIGIGFPSLDKRILARGVIKPQDTARLLAALRHCLYDSCQREGHTCLPPDKLQAGVRALGVFVPPEDFPALLQQAIAMGMITQLEDGVLAHPVLYEAENTIAEVLLELNTEFEFKVKPKDDLNELQQHALINAINHGVSVLTGGPGTGKTHTEKAILVELASKGGTQLLCAPTGKAAKRMTEATGHKASTMHSLLNYFGREAKPRDDDDEEAPEGIKGPLDLIIDECSMVGVELLAALLRKAHTPKHPVRRIILIGDDDQLPSISPGRVLFDIIESKRIPTVKLLTVMRQAEGSAIALNAARIRKGEEELQSQNKSDFVVTNPDKGPQHVLEVMLTRLPAYGFNLISDVQVLAPTYAGEWGCDAFNGMLQAALNPPSAKKKEYNRGKDKLPLREGDKVIIVKNNYNLGVVNGDIGTLVKVHNAGTKSQLTVSIDDREVEFKDEHLLTIQLAYCVTVHKAQGSEAPMVVALFSQTPPMMMQRNLLYTAITRGKRRVWLVASEATISRMIRTVDQTKRCTRLCKLLAS